MSLLGKKVDPVRARREEVWRKLWADPKYLRIQAFKDKALRAWNYADARKSKDLPQATRRKDRALARQYRYENAALLKAGLTP